MSQVVFISSVWKLYALNQGHNTHSIRHRTHRRDGTGGALKKLEPNDLIVFRTGIGEMAPVGEIATGVPKK